LILSAGAGFCGAAGQPHQPPARCLHLAAARQAAVPAGSHS
jgi:hypothetical protein